MVTACNPLSRIGTLSGIRHSTIDPVCHRPTARTVDLLHDAEVNVPRAMSNA